MSRIRILPDHVANQIAAGEVVERPASVVKELLENALDAGASRIDVELRNGGKTRIRVADDGSGMGRADALLALDRHATSKIGSVEDLRGVASFGFRGEALPSIAAVSRFDLETAPAGDGPGTHVRVAAGRILSTKEIARQPGTTVTVRSLFQNVPARAKFLRSAAVETRAVSEAVVLLALSHLEAGIRLESNGRELLDLGPARTLGERVAAIWGEEESDELLEIDEAVEGIRVGGLVQRPDAARPAGGRRYLFVNGRPFRDPGLLRVVDAAYRTTVAPGLRPSAFLRLEIQPDAVDVNVHPAKAEVRFRDRPALVEALESAVRRSLGAVSSAPPIGRPEAVSETAPLTADMPTSEVRETPQLAFLVAGAAPADVAVEAEGEPLRAHTGAAEVAAGRPGLWQLHDAYILAATREGLLIIDQHSAHERVLYEEIMGRFAGEGSVSQRLLFPLTLRLPPAELAAVEELGGLLSKVGFEVEAFGDRTVIVRSAPNPHPYFDAEACFRGMIEELANGSDLVNSARNQHERIAKSLACKAAIKAGQTLSEEEMLELFDRLFATELPGHDVHGRPTILRLTLAELARRFGRT
ncbi:MAG: DNA mismatch repair endonuclease MutL [Gemmatimonadota bacterium]